MSIQAGDDIKTMQENLGHYSAAFTLDAYGHVTEQMRRDNLERMDRYIEKLAR
jgi:integrase